MKQHMFQWTNKLNHPRLIRSEILSGMESLPCDICGESPMHKNHFVGEYAVS